MKEVGLRAYRAMEMARAFDTKLSALYKAGKMYGGGKPREADKVF